MARIGAVLKSGDDLLHLRAQDLEDLTVIGTMIQDGLAPAGDMRLLKEERQFIIVFNRFRWEKAGETGPYSRIHAGLRFDKVQRVQFRGIDWHDPDKIMSILTIAHSSDPGGDYEDVVIHFAGGAAIRIMVDRLECALDDLGDPWPTQWKPGHEPD